MSERKVVIPKWTSIKTIYDLRMVLWKLPDEAKIEALVVKDGEFNADLFLPD
jgi:hypothetical protein